MADESDDREAFGMENFLDMCFRTRVKLQRGELPSAHDWGSSPDRMLFVSVRIVYPADDPVECPFFVIVGMDQDSLEAEADTVSIRVPNVESFKAHAGKDNVLELEYRAGAIGGDVAMTPPRKIHLRCVTRCDMRTLKGWLDGEFHKKVPGGKLRGVKTPLFASLAKSVSSGFRSFSSVASMSRSYLSKHGGTGFMDKKVPYDKWTPIQVLEWMKHVYISSKGFSTTTKQEGAGEYTEVHYGKAVALDTLVESSQMAALEKFLVGEKLGMHNLVDLYKTYLENPAMEEEEGETDDGGFGGPSQVELLKLLEPVFKNKRLMKTIVRRVSEMQAYDDNCFNPNFNGILKKKIRKNIMNFRLAIKERQAGSTGVLKKLFHKKVNRLRIDMRLKSELRTLWDPSELRRQIMFAQLFRKTLSDWLEHKFENHATLRRLVDAEKHLTDWESEYPEALKSLRVAFGKDPDAKVENCSFQTWAIHEMYKCRVQLKIHHIANCGKKSLAAVRQKVAAAKSDAQKEAAADLQRIFNRHEALVTCLRPLTPSAERKWLRTHNPGSSDAPKYSNKAYVKWLYAELNRYGALLKKYKSVGVKSAKGHEMDIQRQIARAEAESDTDRVALLKSARRVYVKYYEVLKDFKDATLTSTQLDLMLEFHTGEDRSRALEHVIGLKLRKKIPEGQTRRLPVKLIIAKFTGDTTGGVTGGLIGVGVNVGQLLFGVGAPFGYFHALFSVGNCRFEWNADALVRFQILDADDGYDELLCAELVADLSLVDRHIYEEKMQRLATALVCHSVQQNYKQIGRKSSHTENCQQFAMTFIQDELGVSEIPPLVTQFTKHANWKSCTGGDPIEFAKKAACLQPSADFIDKIHKKGGVPMRENWEFHDDKGFEGHDQLDAYANQILKVCTDPEVDIRPEWEYMRALDRGMWMRELKAANGNRKELGREVDTCPFNAFEKKFADLNQQGHVDMLLEARFGAEKSPGRRAGSRKKKGPHAAAEPKQQ